MTIVYVWRIPDELDSDQIDAYDRAIGPNELAWSEGRRIDVPLHANPVVRFECSAEKLRRNDCVHMDAQIPIVNERLRRFLEERANECCQFIEVDIVANEGEVAGYFILNATAVVQCVDRKASAYFFVPGTDHILGFRKLVFLEQCMGTRALARDSAYLSYLLVKADLATALVQEGFSGVEMVEASSLVP